MVAPMNMQSCDAVVVIEGYNDAGSLEHHKSRSPMPGCLGLARLFKLALVKAMHRYRGNQEISMFAVYLTAGSVG